VERLEPHSTVLVVVDVQERLAQAMEAGAMARLTANVGILLEVARLLAVPLLVSEQYPSGLGPTIAPLRDKLTALGATPISKLDFDAVAEPVFARALGRLAPRTAIVLGMESHVCVYQTARELVRRGIETHVVADAVASRREENRLAGLDLAQRAGAIVTVTEAVAFDLVRRAGTDVFKAVSKLVK